MTRFMVELSSDSPGFVTGKLVDADHGEGIILSVTVVTDSTRTSQKRVLAMMVEHLNWFVDLSHGGTK